MKFKINLEFIKIMLISNCYRVYDLLMYNDLILYAVALDIIGLLIFCGFFKIKAILLIEVAYRNYQLLRRAPSRSRGREILACE